MKGKKLLMRSSLICLVFSAMIVSLALMTSSCAKKESEIPTAEVPADYKPITLKVNMPTPPAAGYWEHCFKPLFDRIKEMTDGRVNSNVYFQNQLCSPIESSDAVRAGIADFSWAVQGYTPGKFPLSSVVELPFLIPNPVVAIGGPILRDLYEEFPEIRAEYKDWKVLWLQVHMAADIHSKKPITSLDDLKGMKILTQPAEAKIEAMKALGATPLNIDISDFYLSLERGMAEAAFIAWGAYEAMHLYELTSNHYLIAMLPVPCYYIMNKETFNKMLPQDQKVVETVFGLGGWGAMRDSLVWSRSRVINGPCKDDTYIQPSPEDIAKARTLAKSLWDKWAADRDAQGLPGTKVLKRVLELVEKYKNV
jgi:TRAP-type C4-dicarboxylate transport system substrate-binding protein